MKERTGDLLSLSEGIIAHGCNTLGVMGAGVALQVRKKYPMAFRAYREAFEQKGLRLGEVIWYQAGPKLWIANAITQARIYGKPGEMLASMEAIEEAFSTIGSRARQWGLEVSFPLIGCGLAGGSWDQVGPRVERALGEVDSTLWRWEPKPSAAPKAR